MSKIYNKTIIIGRLGNTPSLMDCDGKCYTTFKLANTMVDRDGNDRVDWHDIKAVGKQARVCCQYLNKGDLCCIEGSVDNDHIIAERVTFLSSKKKAEQEFVWKLNM